MRITYLHQYFSTPRDPGMTRSYEMARRLVKAGHEVNMITTRRGGESSGDWEVTDEDGIIVHWVPIPYSNYLSYRQRMVAFVRYAVRSAMRAASLEADVIFATSGPLTVALPAIYAKRRRKVPMVFEVRDLWPRGAITIGALRGRIPIAAAQWLEKLAYDNSAQIVALAPSIQEGIVERGFPVDRIHVIPNSSDVALFQVPREEGLEFRGQYDWLGDRPMVLYAGTLGRVNGVDYLAEIAAYVAPMAPDVRFVVVGDGAMAPSIRSRAVDLKVLDKNFFMLGARAKAEMPAIFSAASITTGIVIDNPLLWGDSANKVFDSYAAGRPIAINYGGWQAEILQETGAGIVLPAADPERAAKMLVETLYDSAFLKSAGEAGLTLARTRFSRDDLAKQLEQVLISAVA